MAANLNQLDVAKRALAILEDEQYRGKSLSTVTLTLRLGYKDNTDEHTFVRQTLNRLYRLGILQRQGKGKFFWGLINREYNRDNPFRTPKQGTNGNKGTWNVKCEAGVCHITGDTFDYKDSLKAIGCKFDGELKAWWISDSKQQDIYNLAAQKGIKVEGGVVKQSEPSSEPVQQVAASNTQWEQDVQEEFSKLRAEIARLGEMVGKTVKTEITIKAPDREPVVIKERVHPIFQKVMFHLSCGDNVMLVGPRGCGKTYLASQVSNALTQRFCSLSLSGGVTEAKLFGRVTPNVSNGKNEYHPAQFVEFFENGGVFLLDEVDAGDPNVLLSLNSALANGEVALDRSKKPMAQRHKEFTCLAAANTWGNGANRQYVGRNQQDNAFTERFVQIEMDYDAQMEKELCPGAEDMVAKLQEYRQRIVDNRMERSISTRFICRAYNWIKNGKDMAYVEEMLFAGWRDDEVKRVRGIY